MMTGESNELWNSVLNENVALRRQVTEMEGFLEDHGLVWVGTGATISLPISLVQNTVENEKVRRFQKPYFSSRARPFLNEDTDLGSSVCVTRHCAPERIKQIPGCLATVMLFVHVVCPP